MGPRRATARIRAKSSSKENGFPKNVTFIPSRECTSDDPHPKLSIISPKDGDKISSSPLDVYGIADATKWFDYYELDYGVGDDPVEWKQLEKKKSPVEQPDILYEWDLQQLVQENDLSGPITLRLYLHSTEDKPTSQYSSSNTNANANADVNRNTNPYADA